MRKYIFALLLLLAPVVVFAWGGSVMVVGGGTPVAGGACAYEIQETFDGAVDCGNSLDTNCIYTWAVGADSIRYNGTTTTLPDSGYYALANNISGTGAAYTSKSISATGAVSIYGKIRITTLSMTSGDTFPIFGVTSSADASAFLCALGVNFDGTNYNIVASSGGSDSVGGSVNMAINTTYRLWVDYVKNTSCKAYISTTDTKGDEQVVSTGVPNTDAAKFRFGSHDGGVDHDVDSIKWDRLLSSSGASCVLGDAGALP